MAAEDSINARLQAIAGVIAPEGSTEKRGGQERRKTTEPVEGGKLLVGNEGEKLRRDSLREGEKLGRDSLRDGNAFVGKEGKVKEKDLKRKKEEVEKKASEGKGEEKVFEKKASNREGVGKGRSKTTGREIVQAAAAQAFPHSRSSRRSWTKEGGGAEKVFEKKALKVEGIGKALEGVKKHRSKTSGREIAAVGASPRSHSARRRSRWDDAGDLVEKKIAFDLKAGSDAFLPIIDEIEALIGKGKTEKTAAALDKNDDGKMAKKPISKSATPQSSQCENSQLNRFPKLFKSGKCEVDLKQTPSNSPPIFSQQERTAFVLGLSPEVQAHDLEEYFGRFGEVESAKVACHHPTGFSRGFAFVVFKDMSARMDVTAQGEHVIKGKKAKCRWAGPGWKEIKIRVENLPSKDLSDDELADHFSQFGPVADVIRPEEEVNNNQKFCFIVFDKEETGLKLIEQGWSNIDGHKIVIKSVSKVQRRTCFEIVILLCRLVMSWSASKVKRGGTRLLSTEVEAVDGVVALTVENLVTWQESVLTIREVGSVDRVDLLPMVETRMSVAGAQVGTLGTWRSMPRFLWVVSQWRLSRLMM